MKKIMDCWQLNWEILTDNFRNSVLNKLESEPIDKKRNQIYLIRDYNYCKTRGWLFNIIGPGNSSIFFMYLKYNQKFISYQIIRMCRLSH